MGKGDAVAADHEAVRAMHHALNELRLGAQITVGEGVAPDINMLYVGETVGDGDEIAFDIALDALECTKSVAFGRSNAMAVLAIASRGDLYRPPARYLHKIAVGPDAKGAIDLSLSVEENLGRVAETKGYKVSDLTVVVLDRERHAELIESIRKTGARVHLIPDGDVAAAIATALPGTGIDLLMGTGGSAAGVLAAAALRCLGGEIHTRLAPVDQKEIDYLKSNGQADLNRMFRAGDLARGNDMLFAATGVTDGDILNGVAYRGDGATTHSLVLNNKSKTRRFVVTEHYFDTDI